MPFSDSEAVTEFEVMWWSYRYHFNSHYGGGWLWIFVSSVKLPSWLSSSALLILGRDQINKGNRALFMRKNEKGGYRVLQSPDVIWCLECPVMVFQIIWPIVWLVLKQTHARWKGFSRRVLILSLYNWIAHYVLTYMNYGPSELVWEYSKHVVLVTYSDPSLLRHPIMAKYLYLKEPFVALLHKYIILPYSTSYNSLIFNNSHLRNDHLPATFIGLMVSGCPSIREYTIHCTNGWPSSAENEIQCLILHRIAGALFILFTPASETAWVATDYCTATVTFFVCTADCSSCSITCVTFGTAENTKLTE